MNDIGILEFGSYLKGKVKLIFSLIVFSFCLVPFTCRSCMDNGRLYLIIGSFMSIGWIFMWVGNEYINHSLNNRIPWTKHPVKRLIAGLIAVVIYTPVVLYALQVSFEKIMDIPLGNKYSIIIISAFITVVITLFLTGRTFLFNWRQVAIDAEKFRSQSIAANYESLKNQVNPHFLFNSLNALTNLVYEDQEKAVKFIKQLSEVYRYVLDTRDKEVVSLEEELKFLTSYVYLQQIRFGDKLRVRFDLNGTRSMVAPLALQMLIENAIKHNELSEEKPLSIRVFSQADAIVVENDLQRRQFITESSSGVGLENIRRRYEFLTSGKVEVREDDRKFIVRLPVISYL